MSQWNREMSERLSYLLGNETVEYVSQDHPTHLTIKFKSGPRLLIGIQKDPKPHLDCSVLEDTDTSSDWSARANDPNGPRMPKR